MYLRHSAVSSVLIVRNWKKNMSTARGESMQQYNKVMVAVVKYFNFLNQFKMKWFSIILFPQRDHCAASFNSFERIHFRNSQYFQQMALSGQNFMIVCTRVVVLHRIKFILSFTRWTSRVPVCPCSLGTLDLLDLQNMVAASDGIRYIQIWACGGSHIAQAPRALS